MRFIGRHRRFFLQAALLAAVLGLLTVAGVNAAANLERKSLPFGLDFLARPAGFPLLQSLISFDERSTLGRAFLAGLLNTLLVAAIGIVFATAIGFAVGIARLSPLRSLRWPSAGYVELVRNLPLLLILFFLYFGVLRQLPPPRQSYAIAGVYLNNRGLFLPGLDFGGHDGIVLALAACALCAGLFLKGKVRVLAVGGAAAALIAIAWASAKVSWPMASGLSVSGGMKLIPEFLALAAALSIYTAAYIAEIVRAGIEAVPAGQREAAEALGLTPWQTTRLVVVPQALRLAIPPLTSQYLNLTKNSSLAVAIAYPDLVSVFAGTTLAQTGRALEIMAITMGVYLALSLATAAMLNLYNARVLR